MSYKALKFALECPFCYEEMTGGIYICASGHSICYRCNREFDLCPLCEKNLLNQRNHKLEEVATQCKKMMEIEFRDISCKTGVCRWIGCADDILGHVLRDNHALKMRPIGSGKYFVDISLPYKILGKASATCNIVANNAVFQLFFRRLDDKVCFMAVLIGSPREARKYVFDIKPQPPIKRTSKPVKCISDISVRRCEFIDDQHVAKLRLSDILDPLHSTLEFTVTTRKVS